MIVFSEVIEGELHRDERFQHGTLRNCKPSGPSSSVLQPSGFSEVFLRVRSSNNFQTLGCHSGFPVPGRPKPQPLGLGLTQCLLLSSDVHSSPAESSRLIQSGYTKNMTPRWKSERLLHESACVPQVMKCPAGGQQSSMCPPSERPWTSCQRTFKSRSCSLTEAAR